MSGAADTEALRIAVAGASGRMGRMLIEAVLAAPDCRLTGALDVAGCAALGQDAGAFAGRHTGVAITSDLHAGLAQAQVLIDFTRPEGTLAHLQACRELGVKAVIGTTGFTEAQKATIADHARHIGIVLAPNMSVGVNVVFKLLDMAARALDQRGGLLPLLQRRPMLLQRPPTLLLPRAPLLTLRSPLPRLLTLLHRLPSNQRLVLDYRKGPPEMVALFLSYAAVSRSFGW